MVKQVREAMHRLGTRADAMGTCPICGGPVNSRQDRVRIWHRTYAHGSCASYRRRNSHRFHDPFTAA